MEFTIGFYDTFDHLTARASVNAGNEIEAIQKAAETCNQNMSKVGRIELTSSEREWLERLDDDARSHCHPSRSFDYSVPNETTMRESRARRNVWDGKRAGGGTFERGE